MKKLSALPSWALTRLIIWSMLPRLRPDHPWIGRKFRLGEWAEGRTKYTRDWDKVSWFLLGCWVLVLLFRVLRGKWL